MKITKKQIKEAYNDPSKLKEWFPSAFEEVLEVGKWYKHDESGCLFNYQKEYNVYGFFKDGKWNAKNWTWVDIDVRKATTKEVETALINEGKKRGYKDGNYKCLRVEDKTHLNCINYDYDLKENVLFICSKTGQRNVVFDNGTWATIIKPKQMTQEQIEKELGYKIEIV